jgi:hypothetical protein
VTINHQTLQLATKCLPKRILLNLNNRTQPINSLHC